MASNSQTKIPTSQKGTPPERVVANNITLGEGFLCKLSALKLDLRASKEHALLQLLVEHAGE